MELNRDLIIIERNLVSWRVEKKSDDERAVPEIEV